MYFNVRLVLGSDSMVTYGDIADALRLTASSVPEKEKVRHGETVRILDKEGNPLGYWSVRRE